MVGWRYGCALKAVAVSFLIEQLVRIVLAALQAPR